MATRTGLLVKGDGQIVTASWSGLLQSSSDVGSALHLGNIEGATCQLGGTLGTGGAVTMQGSNDGTNWGTLQDPAGNAIVMDAIGEMFVIANRPLYIRPNVTAGNGSTNLSVIVVGMRKGT